MTRRSIWLPALWLVLGCDAVDTPMHTATRSHAIEPTAIAAAPHVEPPMVGVLVPEAELDIVSPGFARLERLELAIGDRVAAGDVIAVLDVRGDRSELAAATAAWRAAKAELERLDVELEQARSTRSELEQLEAYVAAAELREREFAEQLAAARRRSADASLGQRRAAVREAETRLTDASLRAPFEALVSRRHVDPGATLATGEPIVELMSTAKLVRFAAPEHTALAIGTALRVRFDGSDVDLDAELVHVSPQIEAGTRLIIAEARLAPDPRLAQLRVGAIARVRLP